LPKAEDIKISTSSACVIVSDNGFGISEKILPSLFKAYSQGKTEENRENLKGTGLGLSIIKGLAEVHGGKVGVVSKDGFGSSFFFTLPI
jgi:two-component system heavy metal sensor histidine kinase CusS